MNKIEIQSLKWINLDNYKAATIWCSEGNEAKPVNILLSNYNSTAFTVETNAGGKKL
jgi:hypothetical protein